MEEDFRVSFSEAGLQHNEKSVTCMANNLIKLYGEKEVLQASKENRQLGTPSDASSAELGTFSCMDDNLLKRNFHQFGISSEDTDCAFEELGKDKIVEILETNAIGEVSNVCQ